MRGRRIVHVAVATVCPSDARDGLVRRLLSQLTGLAPDAHRFVRRCLVCGGDHGKPYLLTAPYDVSWSLSGPFAAAAVSAHGPVGIDLEQAERTGFAGFGGVALGPGESASDDEQRARTWTRKEAVLKATGHGLSVDPRTVIVSAPAATARLVQWRAAPSPIQLRDLPAPAGYACSVAVVGGAAFDVRLSLTDEATAAARRPARAAEPSSQQYPPAPRREPRSRRS